MAGYERKTKKKQPKQTVEGKTDKRGSRPGECGNPPFEPCDKDRQVVRDMAGNGATQEDIALRLGISVDTMTKYYGKDWQLGKIETKNEIAGALVKAAKEGCATRQIFYLKTQAGWKETTAHEHTGKDGNPIETRQLPATDEWLKQFAGTGTQETS